jgi:hypothetical protein
MAVPEDDRKLALEITNRRVNIAEAIAKGIAVGRQQGIERRGWSVSWLSFALKF